MVITAETYHVPVLLRESVDGLAIQPDGVYVDVTFGGGGHSKEILSRLGSKGHLYSFDQDADAEKNIVNDDRFTFVRSNFRYLNNWMQYYGVEKIDGLLADLGVSSHHFDDETRGFSFRFDAPLDMRMNQEQILSAYNVVNEYDENKLSEIILKYGEEKYSRSIAKNIVKNRPINTTLELVEVIKEAVPMKYKLSHHPARKTFQAIRIEVNNELEVFKSSLLDALSLIDIGGRICVITFHSLEDRICKEIFKSVTTVKKELQNLPIIPKEYLPKFKIVKTINPSIEEVNMNKRARSAKLRVIERID